MAVLRIGARACAAWMVLAAVLLTAARAMAAADDPRVTADVRRALTLLNVVGEEYREGVRDGRVVLPVEYEESRTFLDEAQARVRDAAPAAAAATDAAFAAVRADVQTMAPLEHVRAGLAGIRAAIVQSTGVAEEIYPPAAPSAARGRALFAENCVSCHGERADGHGAAAARLNPPPANFTDAEFMRRETPFSFFNIISAGKGTSMPAWADVFSLQERWDLVSYLYTVQPGAAGLAEGQRVYRAGCAGCHGIGADGATAHTDARAAAPALNTLPSLAQRTDQELYAAVAHGRSDASMPAFAGQLGDADMWVAVRYLRMLSLGGVDGSGAVAADSDAPRRFAGLLRQLSEQYRKALATGPTVNEPELGASAVLLDQLLRQAPRVQSALAADDPTAAAALPVQLEQIATAVNAREPAAQVGALIGPLAQSLDASVPPAGAGAAAAAGEQLIEAQRLLEQALLAYRAGDKRAVYLVSDAYFLFDPLEKQLLLSDAVLARRTEARFAELRSLFATPGRQHEAELLVAAIGTDLKAARGALAPRQRGYGVAVESGFIILREGFEVVLIVGALLGYVRKAGAPAMRRPILWGAVAGVVASALTAFALARLFQATGATGDVLEGATMLLAAAVLFFVSYWLISKAESARWQRYIQGKVSSALATGNVAALGGAAFLAVYREGTETILFYKALIDSAPGALAAVLVGLACGALALAVVYLLYTRLGSRLPMRQFFLATGGLLYYLAVVFAGKGVAELQGAGWISTTTIGWVPRVEFIGLYPTAETLAAQSALLLCVVYALVVTLRRSRRHEPAAELAIKVPSHGSAKF
jgi:high-affinity iron transporter